MQTTPTGKIALSLADLESFDPHGGSGIERRFCCPLPGCNDVRRDASHRNLTANTQNGKWRCMRCKASGLLTEFWTEREPENYKDRRRAQVRKAFALDTPPKQERPVKPVEEWRDRLGSMQHLPETPGAVYLEGRGLPADLCHESKVRYSPDFCRGGEKQSKGFAAVVFPVTSQEGKTVAAQGRAIQGKGKITFGTKSAGVFATPGAIEAPSLVVTEAPIDALSLAYCGVPAVATLGTDGYPEFLLSGRAFGGLIVAAFDADEAGRLAAEDLHQRGRAIGATVTRVTPPEPYKDWNEALQGMGRDALVRLLAPYNADRYFRLIYEAGKAARMGLLPRCEEWFSTVSHCREMQRQYGPSWRDEPEGAAASDHLLTIAEEWQKTAFSM